MNFIELTHTNGKIFIGNINLLQRVFALNDGRAVLVGLGGVNNIEVQETYEEVIQKVNARLAGVTRLK